MKSREEMIGMTTREIKTYLGGRRRALEDFIAYYEELVRLDEADCRLGYVPPFMSETIVTRMAEEHKQLLELLKELQEHREFLDWLENHILPNEWEQYQNQYKNRFDDRKSEV